MIRIREISCYEFGSAGNLDFVVRILKNLDLAQKKIMIPIRELSCFLFDSAKNPKVRIQV